MNLWQESEGFSFHRNNSQPLLVTKSKVHLKWSRSRVVYLYVRCSFYTDDVFISKVRPGSRRMGVWGDQWWCHGNVTRTSLWDLDGIWFGSTEGDVKELVSSLRIIRYLESCSDIPTDWIKGVLLEFLLPLGELSEIPVPRKGWPPPYSTPESRRGPSWSKRTVKP